MSSVVKNGPEHASLHLRWHAVAGVADRDPDDVPRRAIDVLRVRVLDRYRDDAAVGHGVPAHSGTGFRIASSISPA